MTWQEAVATVVILAGLGAGAFLIAQRPAFWVEFGFRILKAIAPSIWGYISKRMTPAEEAAWHQAERRGQGDEWLRDRWRRRRQRDK